jgi:hypothetical protein
VGSVLFIRDRIEDVSLQQDDQKKMHKSPPAAKAAASSLLYRQFCRITFVLARYSEDRPRKAWLIQIQLH